MRAMAYEGKDDCTSMYCRRFVGLDEPGCIGWHCAVCDEPCSQYGHPECYEKRETPMRFRSKPSEIEAVRWTGENLEEIEEFGVEFG